VKRVATILIDTYNYGRFIEEAIESALNQTLSAQDLEVLVVDDGSTDDTPERVAKYKDKITYLRKSNGGQASAFNAGFEAAQGEYIILLDSDDCCKRDRAALVVEEFERHPETAIVVNARHIKMPDREIFEQYPDCRNLRLDRTTLRTVVKCAYGTSRTAVRKSALQRILPLPDSLRIEADLFLLALLWVGNISSINKCLTMYRVHDSNLFHSTRLDRIPLKAQCIGEAISGIDKLLRTSADTDRLDLIEEVLLPYKIEQRELLFALDVESGTAERAEAVSIEKDKFKLYWHDWPLGYRIYKLMRLPLFYTLSPRQLSRLGRLYQSKNLKRFRQLVFPFDG